MIVFCFFFFFSSRRRHTRSLCDWSSDVCSSDLSWTSAPAADSVRGSLRRRYGSPRVGAPSGHRLTRRWQLRSEEHTSELQSHSDLVCRLLLEKKKRPDSVRLVPLRAACRKHVDW